MFLVISIEFSSLENLEWRRKVFRIDVSPAKSAPGQNKFTRDEKTKSWSLRPIKWITVEEQIIIHEWHLIYSNLIAQNLNVCSFSVCIVLCDESIVLLKNNFWGPAVNLVYCYGHIIYCSPLQTSCQRSPMEIIVIVSSLYIVQGDKRSFWPWA